MRRAAGLAVALTLTACATTGTVSKEDYDALAKAPVCCTEWTALSYEPTALRAPIERDIGPQGPAFVFDGEKSFFQAFELPRSARTLVVAVEAASLQRPFQDSTMFYPVVAFLNERKEAVFTLLASTAVLARGNIIDGDRMLQTRVVHPEDEWRYFVVYTTPETLKAGRNTVRVVNPETTRMVQFAPGLFFPMNIVPRDDIRGLPASPTARIKVTVIERQRPG